MINQDKILRIVSEVLRNKNVRFEHNLIKDLGADSVDIMEILMMLEDGFDIEIPDNSFDNLETVKDNLAYMDNRIGF